LGKEPIDIHLGDLVRNTEPDFNMAECFNRERNACILSPSCALKGVLSNATNAYLAVLDGATLQDLLMPAGAMAANKPMSQTIRMPMRVKAP
jgi:Rrf2 family nitric oxide-sensitive transcriptional repressor